MRPERIEMWTFRTRTTHFQPADARYSGRLLRFERIWYGEQAYTDCKECQCISHTRHGVVLPYAPAARNTEQLVRTWQCPLWVKSGHVQCKRACPLHPRKRR